MSRPLSILELRSVWGTGGGPEKTILRGASLHDPGEFAVTVCYIRDGRDALFTMAERAQGFGVDYVEVPERHSFDPGIWRSLVALVRQRAIDVVHSHDYKTDLLAWLLARRTGITPLATSHGWSGYSRRERWVYYPVDLLLLRRFPHVIAVSSAIQRRLLRWGVKPERTSVILNAVDPGMYQRTAARRVPVRAALGLPESAEVIGAVGRLEQVKRFDTLLDAFADVAAARPQARLALAGEGTLRQPLVQQAQRLGLAERCHFLGHVTDVADAHHAFDILVQSSESEGTPNAVLEAMAMETPLVATDVGGTRELAADGVHGLLVPRHNPSALAAAILEVLTHPDAARTRVAAARRRVEHELSFQARTHALERVYRTLDRRPGMSRTTESSHA